MGPYHALLFSIVNPWLTRETAVERVAFVWRIALYLVWLAPLILLNLTVDYAKVRAVVEDRHSMLGAFVAGWRFVRRHWGHVVSLYLANALVLAVALAIYILVAPGGRGGDWRLNGVLLIGQAWILSRIATKLAFLATATTIFQQLLAHAVRPRRRCPYWPDSPAAEAIENAAESRHAADHVKTESRHSRVSRWRRGNVPPAYSSRSLVMAGSVTSSTTLPAQP